MSALCPNCNIDLVEANSDLPSDLGTAQATAAHEPGVDVISDSWDVALSDWQDVCNFLNSGPYTFQGITTVAASGDAGYPGAARTTSRRRSRP